MSWTVIADRDYIEQVGNSEVKRLFATNTAEIKTDVVDNIKSLDGDALVSRIEEAMESRNWSHAQDLWAYIKLRRVRLRPDLTQEDQAALKSFIAAKETENVFILERGDLEAYLPDGHRSKDIGKLIDLVASDNFWDELPSGPRADLERIAEIMLGVTPAPGSPTRIATG